METAKISLFLGLVFIALKIAYKRSRNQGHRKLYEWWRPLQYQVHVNASKLAVISALIHGFTVIPIDRMYSITG